MLVTHSSAFWTSLPRYTNVQTDLLNGEDYMPAVMDFDFQVN